MQKKTKIEWTDFTWNPVTGCNHGCYYCYARRMMKRFGKDFKPRFSEGQIDKPYKIKEPSKIFVCSMADLFGNWVPEKWIKRVLEVVEGNPQHTFQFLTKNPARYMQFFFPENSRFGTTITSDDAENKARLDILKIKGGIKFISAEPLMGNVGALDFTGIDLVIVGAMSGPDPVRPKREWIDKIKANKTIKKLFWKENIRRHL